MTDEKEAEEKAKKELESDEGWSTPIEDVESEPPAGTEPTNKEGRHG